MNKLATENDDLQQLREEEEYWSKQDNRAHTRKRPGKVKRERQHIRRQLDNYGDDE